MSHRPRAGSSSPGQGPSLRWEEAASLLGPACREVEERPEDAHGSRRHHRGGQADPVGHQAEDRPGDPEGEEGHHRVDRQHGGAVLRLRLAVQQRCVRRTVHAVHRVGEQVGRDEAGGAGDQAHDDRADCVEHPPEDRGPGDPDPGRGRAGEPGADAEQAPTGGGHGADEGAGLLGRADHLLEPQRHEGLEGDHADRPEDLGGDDAHQHPVAAEQQQPALDDGRGLAGLAQRVGRSGCARSRRAAGSRA